MNRLLIAVLAVGALVIGATVWFTLPRASSAPVDPSKFKFMHCPECMRESLYSPTAIDSPCLRCDKKMVPTAESVKERAGRASPLRRMLAFVLTESVCVLAVVVFILYNPPPPPETDYYYVNCPRPSCRRKMRYAASRAGAIAKCPLCKNTFMNPELPVELHES